MQRNFRIPSGNAVSDFSLAERLIGDTISWEEISRQRLQNANQENQEEQHYA